MPAMWSFLFPSSLGPDVAAQRGVQLQATLSRRLARAIEVRTVTSYQWGGGGGGGSEAEMAWAPPAEGATREVRVGAAPHPERYTLRRCPLVYSQCSFA